MARAMLCLNYYIVQFHLTVELLNQDNLASQTASHSIISFRNKNEAGESA